MGAKLNGIVEKNHSEKSLDIFAKSEKKKKMLRSLMHDQKSYCSLGVLIYRGLRFVFLKSV